MSHRCPIMGKQRANAHTPETTTMPTTDDTHPTSSWCSPPTRRRSPPTNRPRCACWSGCRRRTFPGHGARAPLHLALVLDRSGSMSGEPLAEAKRCARNMIDGLGAGDRAAIFAFDDVVAQFAPLTPASEKLVLAAALDEHRIRRNRPTCTADGTRARGAWPARRWPATPCAA